MKSDSDIKRDVEAELLWNPQIEAKDIAVKVSDETQASTIVEHPNLGRLLIFDPTDDDTPIGDLPDHEQGSYALIVAGDAGELMKMPVTPPEANRLERAVEAELGADGALTAKVSERSFGQAAVDEVCDTRLVFDQ